MHTNMPWSLTTDPGPPYCAAVSFWQTELDAEKAGVAGILDWVTRPRHGRGDFHLFLDLVIAERWHEAFLEGDARMRQAHGRKPYVRIMQIDPQKFEDAGDLVIQAEAILQKG